MTGQLLFSEKKGGLFYMPLILVIILVSMAVFLLFVPDWPEPTPMDEKIRGFIIISVGAIIFAGMHLKRAQTRIYEDGIVPPIQPVKNGITRVEMKIPLGRILEVIRETKGKPTITILTQYGKKHHINISTVGRENFRNIENKLMQMQLLP